MSGRFKSSNRVFPDHLITLKSSAQRFAIRSLLFIVPVCRNGIFCIYFQVCAKKGWKRLEKVGKGPLSRQPGGELF